MSKFDDNQTEPKGTYNKPSNINSKKPNISYPSIEKKLSAEDFRKLLHIAETINLLPQKPDNKIQPSTNISKSTNKFKNTFQR